MKDVKIGLLILVGVLAWGSIPGSAQEPGLVVDPNGNVVDPATGQILTPEEALAQLGLTADPEAEPALPEEEPVGEDPLPFDEFPVIPEQPADPFGAGIPETGPLEMMGFPSDQGASFAAPPEPSAQESLPPANREEEEFFQFLEEQSQGETPSDSSLAPPPRRSAPQPRATPPPPQPTRTSLSSLEPSGGSPQDSRQTPAPETEPRPWNRDLEALRMQWEAEALARSQQSTSPGTQGSASGVRRSLWLLLGASLLGLTFLGVGLVVRKAQAPRRLAALPISGQVMVLRGPDAGQEWDVTGEQIVFGSGEDCDVTLKDVSVAPAHTALTRDPEGIRVTRSDPDCEIRINGRSITEALLRAGDVMEIGQTTLSFEETPGS